MLLWALGGILAVVVRAEYAPVYIFPDSKTASCTDTEWNEVLQTMGNVTSNVNDENGQRRLGEPLHRHLRCPKWCGKYCAAMGVGCVGYGRRQLPNGHARNLNENDQGSQDSQCSDQIAAIDDALRKLKRVSPSCQSLVRGDRNVSCPFLPRSATFTRLVCGTRRGLRLPRQSFPV
jgi:hypothetical protein